jgi:hypothetical protein
MHELGQLFHLRQRRWLIEAVEEAPRLARRHWRIPRAATTTRNANRHGPLGTRAVRDFLDCCHRQWRHDHVDRWQRIEKHELVCRRSNLAGHWARIGVVGAPRAVWRAGSIILAGIIKQRRSAIPTYAA